MPAFLIHIQPPLEGMVRSQSLSTARLIFLISLVVFFTVLFVVVYIWMRKPGFGQHEGHAQPAVARKTPAQEGQSRVDTGAVGAEMAPPNARTVSGPPLEDGPKVAGDLRVS
jgi:hypothetical protein